MYADFEDMVAFLAQGTLHSERVPANFLRTIVAHHLELADAVDIAKKGLFYDKPNEYLDRAVARIAADNGGYANASGELIHGLLGVITEAAELGRLLLRILDGGEVTRQELIDESGDLLFYLQLIAQSHEVACSMQNMAQANQAKLAKRYPNGFEKARAHAPDKAAEAAAQMQLL